MAWRDATCDLDAVQRAGEIRNALAAGRTRYMALAKLDVTSNLEDGVKREISDLLDRLPRCRPTRRGWTSLCPAHGHSVAPNLSIRRWPDGTFKLHCALECKLVAIMGAVGLSRRDAKAMRLCGD